MLRILLILIIFSNIAYANPLPEPTEEQVAIIKPMLNSDRIDYFFGSYGVETLLNCNEALQQARISNLHSVHGKHKIMRTLAVVDFITPIPPDLITAHNQIQRGGSIGSVLREEGWTLKKVATYFGEIELTAAMLQMMSERQNTKGAIYIYQLQVQRQENTNPKTYCHIIEIYSPQYLTTPWLKALYGMDYSQNTKLNKILEAKLNTLKECF